MLRRVSPLFSVRSPIPQRWGSGFFLELLVTQSFDYPSVPILTLPYINSEDVIPAPYQVRGKLQEESSSETMDSGSSPE
jgi:hypothetical protein